MNHILRGALSVALGVVVFSFVSSISVARAETLAEMQARLDVLIRQLAELQALVAQARQGSVAWCPNIPNNLRFGESGSGVTDLQTVLEREGFPVVSSEKDSRSFGESTAAAVSGFQEKYRAEILAPSGLPRGTGFAGPATRAKITALYPCSSSQALPQPTHPTSPSSSPVPDSSDLPNLVATSVLPSNFSPILGESVVITVSVSNTGSADAGYNETLMRVNGVVAPVAATLSSVPSDGVRPAAFYWSCPAVGSYDLSFETDYSARVREANEGDNKSSSVRITCRTGGAFTQSDTTASPTPTKLTPISSSSTPATTTTSPAPLSNLTVKSLTLTPSTPSVGEQIAVTAIFASASAASPAHTAQFLVNGASYVTVDIPHIAAGATYGTSFAWSCPAVGSYAFSARADSGNVVAESNEDDNAGGPAAVVCRQAGSSTSTSSLSPVTDLTANPTNPTDGRTVLTWSPVSGNAVKYRVYRSRDGSSETLRSSTSGTSYTDTGLAEGRSYAYRVRAYTSSDEGAFSNHAFVTPFALQPSLPGPVANLTANPTNPTDGRTVLSWSPAAGAAGYHVYRSKGGEPEGDPTSTAFTSYTDAYLVSGNSYTYRVRAYNSLAQEGASSNSVTVTAGAPQVLAPGSVTNFVADGSQSGSGKITLRWNPVPGATTYTLYRDGAVLRVRDAGFITSLEDTEWNRWGAAYTYSIEAVNGAGSGPRAYASTVGYICGGISDGASCGSTVYRSGGQTSYACRASQCVGTWSPAPGSADTTGGRFFCRDGMTWIDRFWNSKSVEWYVNSSCEQASGGTSPSTPSLPGPVVNLTASPTDPTNGKTVLSWSPAAGAAGYHVYRSKGGEPEGDPTPVSSTSYTDAYLVSGSSYIYRVAAYNSLAKEGPSSGRVTVTAGASASNSVAVPDLTVAISPTESSPAVGQTIRFIVTELNAGGGFAGGYATKIMLENTQISRQPAIFTLSPSNSARHEFPGWMCPAAGTYTFVAVIDSDGVISETDENNNTAKTVVNCGPVVTDAPFSATFALRARGSSATHSG